MVQQSDHYLGLGGQQQQDDDEAEEALSLCDLPLDDHHSSELPPPSSLPSSSEFFEFFLGDLSSTHMCPAEDIIFCGKLVPYKAPPPPDRTLCKGSELQTRVSAAKENLIMMKNSRFLDYQRYSPELARNSPGNCIDGSDKKAAAATKPRWYLPMFGMVKLPSEMELRDIKSRQSRRIPTVLFPPEDNSNSRTSPPGKAAWGLLRALSCKDHTSVSVTTPFGRMPQA